MRTSVSDVFMSFSTRFEGRVPWMYVDIKGLITVGIGNLIDPVDAALGLPFIDKATGSPASRDEIATEWDMLKRQSAELGRQGHRACEEITNLRLTDEAIDSLVLTKAASNETIVRSFFPDFVLYPADAQLGLHSMAWALGPAFSPRWPRFTTALQAGDFGGAAAECRMSEAGNPGVIPRNDANQTLYLNAAAVIAAGADPDVLYYPGGVE
jgi:GH24 family phage-related lysozyme (muramidase)